MFALGDTFLGGGQIHGTHHLWIVINDPAQHGGNVLFVNVTTLTQSSEKTCVLQPGEHPFIEHDSYIRFASARSALGTELDMLEAKKLITRREPASTALIAKVRASAHASPFLPQKFVGLL